MVGLQAVENTQKTLAGVTQTGGNTGHGDQQRLFQRAVLCRFLLARAGQQLGLQQVQGVEVGVAQADKLQGIRAMGQQLLLASQSKHHAARLRQ